MAFVVAFWIVCMWMSSQASVASDQSSGCTNLTCDPKEYEHHRADADVALLVQKRRVMTTTTTTKHPPKPHGSKHHHVHFRRHHRRHHFRPRYRPRYGQRTTMTTTVVSSGVCSGNLGGGVQQASVIVANIGNGLATFDFNLASLSSCCLSSSGASVNVFIKGVNQDSQVVSLQYFLSSPESQNQFLLAANEAPGADFDFNVSTPAFNGEKASGTWTLRVSISPTNASVGFFALDGRITLKIDQCSPSPAATGTSTSGPSTSTTALQTCQGTQSIQNLGAVGITIGPASPGTATNTTIIFNTNLPCSFSAGSVLLDLGNQKVGFSIDVTFVVESATLDPDLRLFLEDDEGVTVQCGDIDSSVDDGLIEYTGKCFVDPGPTLGTFLLIVETSEPAVISAESGTVPELEFTVIATDSPTTAPRASSSTTAALDSTTTAPRASSSSTAALDSSTTSSSSSSTTTRTTPTTSTTTTIFACAGIKSVQIPVEPPQVGPPYVYEFGPDPRLLSKGLSLSVDALARQDPVNTSIPFTVDIPCCIGGAIDVLLVINDGLRWKGIDSHLRLFVANGVTLEIPVVARDSSGAPILIYSGRLDDSTLLGSSLEDLQLSLIIETSKFAQIEDCCGAPKLDVIVKDCTSTSTTSTTSTGPTATSTTTTTTPFDCNIRIFQGTVEGPFQVIGDQNVPDVIPLPIDIDCCWDGFLDVVLSFDSEFPVNSFVKLSVQSNDGPEPVDIMLEPFTGNPGAIIAWGAFPPEPTFSLKGRSFFLVIKDSGPIRVGDVRASVGVKPCGVCDGRRLQLVDKEPGNEQGLQFSTSADGSRLEITFTVLPQFAPCCIVPGVDSVAGASVRLTMRLPLDGYLANCPRNVLEFKLENKQLGEHELLSYVVIEPDDVSRAFDPSTNSANFVISMGMPGFSFGLAVNGTWGLEITSSCAFGASLDFQFGTASGLELFDFRFSPFLNECGASFSPPPFVEAACPGFSDLFFPFISGVPLGPPIDALPNSVAFTSVSFPAVDSGCCVENMEFFNLPVDGLVQRDISVFLDTKELRFDGAFGLAFGQGQEVVNHYYDASLSSPLDPFYGRPVSSPWVITFKTADPHAKIARLGSGISTLEISTLDCQDCEVQKPLAQNLEENGLPVGPGADEGPRNTSILFSVASDCCASTLKFAALLVDQQEFDFNFRMYAKSPSGTERELATIPTPNFDESFPLPVPQGLWYPYVAMALAPNDCFCGEQLNGDWELKFETSKSGSLIVPGVGELAYPTLIFGFAQQCDPCNPKSGIFDSGICCDPVQNPDNPNYFLFCETCNRDSLNYNLVACCSIPSNPFCPCNPGRENYDPVACCNSDPLSDPFCPCNPDSENYKPEVCCSIFDTPSDPNCPCNQNSPNYDFEACCNSDPLSDPFCPCNRDNQNVYDFVACCSNFDAPWDPECPCNRISPNYDQMQAMACCNTDQFCPCNAASQNSDLVACCSDINPSDPRCQSDPCDNAPDPFCCRSPNPCCDSPDPCCGSTDRCCGSTDRCCGDPNPRCCYDSSLPGCPDDPCKDLFTPGCIDPCDLNPCSCECDPCHPACPFPSPCFQQCDFDLPSNDIVFGGKGHGKGNFTGKGTRSHRNHRSHPSPHCKTHSRAWSASRATKLRAIHAAMARANRTNP